MVMRLAVVLQKQPWLSTYSEGVDTRKAAMTPIAGGCPGHWPAAIQLTAPQLRAPPTLMLPRETVQPQPPFTQPEHCPD